MISQIYRFGLILFFYLLPNEAVLISKVAEKNIVYLQFDKVSDPHTKNSAQNNGSEELEELNNRLLVLLQLLKEQNEEKTEDVEISDLIFSINKKIIDSEMPGITESDSYYLIGVYYLLTGKPNSAVSNLKKSISIRDKLKISDLRLVKACYNVGIAYRQLGDFYSTVYWQQKVLEITTTLFGKDCIELIDIYTSLSTAYIYLQENAKAVSSINAALSIAESKPDSIRVETIADLYTNLGVCYTKLANFSKAKIYFEKALLGYQNHHILSGITYINLINSLAITYNSLKQYDKATGYYAKGASLALSMNENSTFNLNIVSNYASILGSRGDTKRGEELLLLYLKKTTIDSADNQQLYHEALFNYAEYLREYKIDIGKSLLLYSKCMVYLEMNPDDLLLKSGTYIGYSLALAASGQSRKALEIIQKFILNKYEITKSDSRLSNPAKELIKPEASTLKLFRTKYSILKALYEENKGIAYLEAAAETSGLVVALLEEMRINISEEDSRLLLGERYRDAYFASIGDFNLLYKLSSDKKYLTKAFELAEKSKVAGLLASTRELKATQFRIPGDVAEFEFRLKNEIGILNAKIDVETLSEKPNSELLNILNESLLRSTRLRDSLILVIEQKYPEYYDMKYNTGVASLEDIHQIIGRNGNYVNYLLSDTILFIFVANRRYTKLIATPVDTSLFNTIRRFRSLLSVPNPMDDALSEYRQYLTTGNELNKILIEPILPYLISNKLIISPDNMLSYIPFETIPTDEYSDERPQYRSIPYLLKKFDISYTYSATFMSESAKRGKGFSNKLMAFAPDYLDEYDIKSAFLNLQAQSHTLRDLPFARQEAQYVAEITGGKLYEKSEARVSVFKKEAGKCDILHLAMHTLLNDSDPMHSMLIFSAESDTIEDRYLKTYELYGIPLVAKMVVLSSCNTGSGKLSTGEGILSLARGFSYSGSQSVVMSMWEIEDRSGTEIVKSFYENLKKGYTKSTALRKARLNYLNSSDQLRSHPYFWSALVVYGNNESLFYSRIYMLIALITSSVILLTVIIYFLRLRYS